SMPHGPTIRAPAYVSCVGDGAPALRQTGIDRGEARASQVTGPSSASVPWSNTPPDMVHSSPTPRRSHDCLQVHQDPGHPGRLEVSGPHAPWPTRSPADASPRPFLTPAQGSGSPLPHPWLTYCPWLCACGPFHCASVRLQPPPRTL